MHGKWLAEIRSNNFFSEMEFVLCRLGDYVEK